MILVLGYLPRRNLLQPRVAIFLHEDRTKFSIQLARYLIVGSLSCFLIGHDCAYLHENIFRRPSIDKFGAIILPGARYAIESQ